MSRIRVVATDDSELCRAVLREVLEAEGDIEIVGEAEDGHAAIEVVAACRPQLMTLDIEMPRMDGLATIEQIMARTPIPILIVTGRPTEQRSKTLFEAVRRGALDVVSKPPLGDEEQARALRAHVRLLARVPVVKHVAGLRGIVAPAPPAGEAPSWARTSSGYVDREIPVLGVAASAGGPAAISYVLSRLPPDFEGCVAVVQHMLPGFAKSFVEFLRADAPLPVEMVTEPTRPRPGVIFAAPDQRHLVRTHAGLWLPSDAPGRRGYRPSADVLFLSLAETCGARAVGVVLSGIGDDGAQGLLAMRNAGALTIAQDEASSSVYGMPRAARENGAAANILALGDIPAAVTRHIKRLAQPPTPTATKPTPNKGERT